MRLALIQKNMKYGLCILGWMLCLCLYAQKGSFDQETEGALRQLDSLVAQKASFHAARNEQIDRLKQQAATAAGQNRLTIYKEILALYTHYQTDSAQVYLDLISRSPETAGDAELQAFCHVAQAEIYSVTALYGEAMRELKQVDAALIGDEHAALRLYYYRIWRTLCGWFLTYSKSAPVRQHWMQRLECYRDSLIGIDSPGESLCIVEADKAISHGQPERAVELLLPYARQMSPDMPDPYISFTLYDAYKTMGQEAQACKYLILAAKADLLRGITEYQALPLLAQCVSEHGQVERAYNYMICAMEDAGFCKAGLRSLEVSNAFPIIDRQYKQLVSEQRHSERVFLYVLGGLLLVLSAGLLYLRKQMIKLRTLRRQQTETNEALALANDSLQQANDELQHTNSELQQTYANLRMADKMKEEYIARYLNRCRDYMDSLVEYRRTTLRLVKENRLEELVKKASSDQVIRKEQEAFYADFDQAFLTLFPDFIEKFNALLQPAERVVPKHDNHLNTELRIFALIRLGVADSARIAHFLNFSLTTVYNYRSKMRNKALGSPTDFERAVSEL